MLLCNYETDYFIGTIMEASGRRYNIPSPDSKERPLIGRNMSEDDVAGFFRTLKIDEDHMDIVKLINHFLILGSDAISSYLGYDYKDRKQIIDECIQHGLIYENYFKLKSGRYFYWYMVDTGGIYALGDKGIKYNTLPYTATLEQKYKQYLKSQFLVSNYEKYTYDKATMVITKSGDFCDVVHLEDVRWSQLYNYKDTVFLVNLEILKELGINGLMLKLAHKLDNNNNTFYNIAKNKFLKLGG